MTVADLEAVISIASSLADAPQWPHSAYANALNPDSIPRRIALVAAIDRADAQPGVIYGFVVANLLPPEAELETIAVRAGNQRRGLGRSLFQALANRMQDSGVRSLLLEVRASNSAQGFYRSLGFCQTGLRRSYYADPVEDAALMSRALG